jgi:integrase
MTVKFKLLRPKEKTGKLKSEPVSIQIVVCNRNTRVELSTGLKIVPKFWGNQEAKSSLIESETINNDLLAIKQRFHEKWKLDKTVSGEGLRGLVQKSINGDGQPDQKKTVEPWIQSFIDTCSRKPATKQVYRVSLSHLSSYAEKANIILTWESFTLDFYSGFTGFLYSIGHNDNTIGKTVKTLKTFISEAFERGLHQNLNFKKKGFKTISAEVDEIYLTEKEIISFYNTDVPAELEDSKNKFVFGCWVGLRYGDLSKLNPNNLIQTLEGPAIKIITDKTGEEVIIPLHPVAEQIWNEWKGLPPKQSNPEFNEQIKLIAEKAGLNEMVQKRNTIKGRVIVEWAPKFKMVKAHTCRRSFATNCYLRGMPMQTIMTVTGHKTEKSFKKYIRITKEQHAAIMAKNFNQETKVNMKIA